MIDAGDPANCEDAFGAPLVVDQWGIYRPTGAVCDTGAVETMPVCSGGVSATKGKLIVSGLGRGPGRQKVQFYARLPESHLPSLSFFGAQLVVDDLGTGQPLVDRGTDSGHWLPGGGVIPFSCHQWRRTSAGYSYRERDHDCPFPPVGSLVRSAKVKDRSTLTPPLAPYVEVKASVTKLTLDAPAGPFDVGFVYGWFPHFSQGNCAKTSFAPTACVTKGSSMKCLF